MQKTPKGGFSAHSGAKKAQKWGFSKKLSKNRQIKSSQVICDPKSQLFMSQFLNFQSETKIGKITHSDHDQDNHKSFMHIPNQSPNKVYNTNSNISNIVTAMQNC